MMGAPASLYDHLMSGGLAQILTQLIEENLDSALLERTLVSYCIFIFNYFLIFRTQYSIHSKTGPEIVFTQLHYSVVSALWSKLLKLLLEIQI